MHMLAAHSGKKIGRRQVATRMKDSRGRWNSPEQPLLRGAQRYPRGGEESDDGAVLSRSPSPTLGWRHDGPYSALYVYAYDSIFFAFPETPQSVLTMLWQGIARHLIISGPAHLPTRIWSRSNTLPLCRLETAIPQTEKIVDCEAQAPCWIGQVRPGGKCWILCAGG